MRSGRRIMFKNNIMVNGKKKEVRRYGTIEKFDPVTREVMEKDIHKYLLSDSGYSGEKYIKIELLLEREELIVNVTGQCEEDYLKEITEI